MDIVDILSLINRIVFASCMICYIIYFFILIRAIRKRDKMGEERKRDLEALQKLNGGDYWRAYAEFKNKYQN